MRALVAAALLTASCGDDLRRADAYLLGDLEVGPDPSYPSSLTSTGPRAWFVAFVGEQAGSATLFSTDGTTNGTAPLLDFDDYPRNLAAVRGRLLFTAGKGDAWGVWTSDGTVDGTVLVRRLATPPDGDYPRATAVVADDLYFVSVEGEHGAASAVWRSDGTEAGTIVLAPFTGQLVGAVDETLVFFDPADRELWRSDGTPGGTTPVIMIPGRLGIGAANAGPRLFFVVEGDAGRAVWVTDGSVGGTREAFPIAGDRSVTAAAGSPSRLVYATTTAAGDGELWTSDGGTPVKVADRGADAIVATADVAYAFGIDGVARVDGTAATQLGDATGARSPHALYDHLVFAAFDPRHGDELWITDGTDEGTRLALDLVSGPESSSTTGLTTVGGKLVFTANVPPFGDEPWAIAIDDLVGNR
jgi:ELWxxDGT repeat protein